MKAGTKRIVVLTTPTSGTSSLWRVVSRYLPENCRKGWFVDECLNRGMRLEDILKEPLPDEGCFIFNMPHIFNFDQDFSNTEFILNFRDPRDMSCNQFFWEFSHPNPNLSDEALRDKKSTIEKMGIDNYVMSIDNSILYKSHMKIVGDQKLLEKVTAVSYVQLCFDTNGVVERLAEFFGINDSKLIEEAKLSEHPSSLTASQHWIGGRWQGADVFPGRARVELRYDTFQRLSERYAAILDVLRKIDRPEFEFFYSR